MRASGAPSKGKMVEPEILKRRSSETTLLSVPGLEWSGYCTNPGIHQYHYEFIGRHDVLSALPCTSPLMFDFGFSRKKYGQWFKCQKLANNRYRLVLYLEAPLDDAMLVPTKIEPTLQKPDHDGFDELSANLKKTSKLIRQYPIEFKSALFEGLAMSFGNGWQLVESYPWLAVRVFTMNDKPAKLARALVRRGSRLKSIAEAVEMPMSFKRIHAKNTKTFSAIYKLFEAHPEIVSHHCPNGPKEQGSWLSNTRKAYTSGSSEFALWVATNWDSLRETESDARVLRGAICDLRDWVRAGVTQQIGMDGIDSICQLFGDSKLEERIRQKWADYSDLAEAGKRFNKDMAVKTVLRLSEEWHERQAAMQAADVEFPEEWFAGGSVGRYRVEPIRTAADLSKMAYHFHNCCSSYAHRIARGDCFLYVVCEQDQLVAMLEIEMQSAGDVGISELKGKRNESVPDGVRDAVFRWWKDCETPKTITEPCET